MRNSLARLLLLLLVPYATTGQYRAALPGYKYEFPRDHFNHPDFQYEWWYYTGNLRSADGRRFGFELTFFRLGVSREPPRTPWDIADVFLAHLALSDLDGGRFYHAQRANRAGPGLAGINAANGRIWNGNWGVDWRESGQRLQAVDERFQLRLSLRAEKPPVIHGENGVSQKASGPGHASQYISLTRMEANGEIELPEKKFAVTGLAWMDHEFFTSQLAPDQTGWNWLGLQLDDNAELMIYDLRRKDGSRDPYSAATFVDSHGVSRHLQASDFSLQPLDKTWTSPATHAVYPVRWKVSVPKLGLELTLNTALPSQELADPSELSPNYWEGAIQAEGQEHGQPAAGAGYLEMTGYDRPFALRR